MKKQDIEDAFSDTVKHINAAIEKALEPERKGTLHDSMRHATLGVGKRLRPCLALTACEAVGGESKSAMPFAISLELIHNFTLVHDDVMDENTLRHGRKAVYAKYGEETAILAGDALFARAFELVAQTDVTARVANQLITDVAQTVFELCVGQQDDLDIGKTKKITEEYYLSMIEKKTAILYETALRGGALIGGGKRIQVDNLAEFGRLFGLGFQIYDDYLDIVGDEGTTGKRVGTDIKEGKHTLIIIDALRNGTDAQKQQITDALGNTAITKKELKAVIETLEDIGSFEYALGRALDYIDRAKSLVGVLPDSASKRLLFGVADYAVGRDK